MEGHHSPGTLGLWELCWWVSEALIEEWDSQSWPRVWV